MKTILIILMCSAWSDLSVAKVDGTLCSQHNDTAVVLSMIVTPNIDMAVAAEDTNQSKQPATPVNSLNTIAYFREDEGLIREA